MKSNWKFAAVILSAMLSGALAQDAKTKYPTMAPLNQYLSADRDEEIALARSAGPASISANAEVMVLTRHGYEVAVKGTNGFTCMVERGWSAGINDTDFWNPRLRGPLCLNPAGAKFEVPVTLKRTELALVGKSKAEIFEELKAAFASKELLPPEPGAMSYMLSKQGYLSDVGEHWHPHLMFFMPKMDPKLWGANAASSPVLAIEDTTEPMTLFLVLMSQWSDGTPGPAGMD